MCSATNRFLNWQATENDFCTDIKEDYKLMEYAAKNSVQRGGRKFVYVKYVSFMILSFFAAFCLKE